MAEFIKSLNNNAMLVRNDDGSESIYMGRGIGFRGMLDMEGVEKIFHLQDSKEKREYLTLFDQVDSEVLSAVSDILVMAREQLGTLHSNLFFVLSGHIDFALKRFRDGEYLENMLLEEIRMLYPREYAVAQEIRNMLFGRFSVRVDDDEVGFLALHLNAGRLHRNVKDALRRTNLVKSLLEIIRGEVPVKDRELAEQIHVSYFKKIFTRMDRNIRLHNPLIPYLEVVMGQDVRLARKLAGKIQQELGEDLSEDEIGYLTIHLNQVRGMVI